MTRIIACISSHPKTEVLLHAARRAAQEAGVGWTALHIETPRHFEKDADYQQRVLRFMTQAEEMGATIIRQPAPTVMDGIRDYLRGAGPCLLLVGHPIWRRPRIWERKPLAERLQGQLPPAAGVRAVPLKGRSLYNDGWADMFRFGSLRAVHILYAALAVLLACIAVEGLRATMSYAQFSVNNYNISILFMLPTIFIASRFGLLPGLVTAAFSYVTMNYVYIQPIHQLELKDYPSFLNAALFVASVVAVALFGSYTHAHAEVLRKRERRMQALFTVNDVISSAFTRADALAKLHEGLSDLLEMPVALFLPPAMAPEQIAQAFPLEDHPLDATEQQALEQCWNELCSTGRATPRHFHCAWRFEPMVAGKDRIGVLGVHIPPKVRLDASFGQLLSAVADQTGNVLARIELAQAMEAQRVSEEREKLRAMLLSSVSHDLRTPLSSIIGSLSVYHGMHDVLSAKRKRELTDTALEEAQRLDSFISNILDMTRLESGSIRFRREWENPEDMAYRVVRRMKARLRLHRVEIMAPSSPVEVLLDIILTEQVIQNLLDNAAKYTPAGTRIALSMRADAQGFALTVSDDGPGIPPAQRPRIFDKYERLKQKDNKIAGTGLGLAIVKAIVEGQGGSIAVEDGIYHGVGFTLRLPADRVRPLQSGAEPVAQVQTAQ